MTRTLKPTLLISALPSSKPGALSCVRATTGPLPPSSPEDSRTRFSSSDLTLISLWPELDNSIQTPEKKLQKVKKTLFSQQ